MIHRSSGRLWCPLLAAALLPGCAGSSAVFDERARAEVVSEVQTRLDDYAAAVTNRDLHGILSFWGEDLVFAGDGAILGGFDEWSVIARRDNEQAGQWVHWTWDNVHILPLSPDAASATLEFTYEKISVAGDTIRGFGSWTYVFSRGERGWQVRHANGHHPQR